MKKSLLPAFISFGASLSASAVTLVQDGKPAAIIVASGEAFDAR